MYHMRPGTKIPFWSPGFKNRPSVQPPGLLRLVSALSVCSVVGFLLFSVATVVGDSSFDPKAGLYVAIVHFILPVSVTYTIATNSPLSRYLILAYSLITYVATLAGWGYFGRVQLGRFVLPLLATTSLLLVLWWLFRSARMRYYYALVSGRPVPDDLRPRAAELAGHRWINPRAKAIIEWTADNLEIVVMVGFIVVVLYAFITTYGS